MAPLATGKEDAIAGLSEAIKDVPVVVSILGPKSESPLKNNRGRHFPFQTVALHVRFFA